MSAANVGGRYRNKPAYLINLAFWLRWSFKLYKPQLGDRRPIITARSTSARISTTWGFKISFEHEAAEIIYYQSRQKQPPGWRTNESIPFEQLKYLLARYTRNNENVLTMLQDYKFESPVKAGRKLKVNIAPLNSNNAASQLQL